jgi:hypothetical protein
MIEERIEEKIVLFPEKRHEKNKEEKRRKRIKLSRGE